MGFSGIGFRIWDLGMGSRIWVLGFGLWGLELEADV